MRTNEDPTALTPYQWLKRALNLPFREIVTRVFRLTVSVPQNLIKIRRYQYIAASLGKSVHFIALTDRLGDILAAESTVRKIKKSSNYIVWVCQTRFTDLLKFNPEIDAILPVSSYTEMIILRTIDKKNKWTNLHIDGYLCDKFGFRANNKTPSNINLQNYYNFGTLADVYSLIGTGQISNAIPRIYPDRNFNAETFLSKIFDQPENPLLIIHPVSDEAARSWSESQAQVTINWFLENTNFNILEVGLTPVLKPYSKVHLLRDQLALSSQFSLFQKASFFIGVDSGFSHVANASTTPSILLLSNYRNFKNHLPWKLNQYDTVIRNEVSVSRISASIVIDSYKEIEAKIVKRKK